MPNAPKPGFSYDGKTLTADGLPLPKLAERFGTPLYVYSGPLLRENFHRVRRPFASADPMVAYSVKANSNLAVLDLLHREGAWFDIVSGGELKRVLKAGIPAERAIFAGVGKSAEEMRAALRAGVMEFNLESEQEAERLADVARSLRRRADVAIRINPNVDARTHKYITTGKTENKFGVPLKRALRLARRIAEEMPALNLAGVHCHIGSQILDSSIHPNVVAAVMAFVDEVERETGAKLETLNFGGGYGIAYERGQKPLDLRPFARALLPELKRRGLRLILEPGRSIAAAAGLLLSRVEYVKPGDAKTFVILDASMTELLRPALYRAHHEILPVEKRAMPSGLVDFVGPVCETGDFLALDRESFIPSEGGLVAVMDAGAYGFVMASNYNTRPMAAEVLVDGGEAHLVRKRQTLNDLLRLESIPGVRDGAKGA